jgi:hypothetical protein
LYEWFEIDDGRITRRDLSGLFEFTGDNLIHANPYETKTGIVMPKPFSWPSRRLFDTKVIGKVF